MVDANKIVLPLLKRFGTRKSLILDKRSDIFDFELVISDKEKDRHVRYVSNDPSVAVGEYVLEHFTKKKELKELSKSYIYIESVDEENSYIVYVSNGEVDKELFGLNESLKENFEFFVRNENIITSDKNLIEKIGFKTEKVILVEKVDVLNVPDKFYLLELYETEYRIERIKKIISCVCWVLLLGAVGVWSYKYLNPPPPPPPPPPKPPVVVWKESLASKTPLVAGLTELTKALSYFYLLPTDWKIAAASINDKQIYITVRKIDSESRLKTLDMWIEKYPEVSAWFNKDSLTFTFPIKEVYQEKWYRLGNYKTELHDLLISLGASRLAMNTLPSIGKVNKTQYSFSLEKVTFASLLHLSEMLVNKPISIDAVNIQQLNEPTMITANITFTLEGV